MPNETDQFSKYIAQEWEYGRLLSELPEPIDYPPVPTQWEPGGYDIMATVMWVLVIISIGMVVLRG